MASVAGHNDDCRTSCVVSCPAPGLPMDVDGHKTRQVDERLDPSLVPIRPGNEATENLDASVQ